MGGPHRVGFRSGLAYVLERVLVVMILNRRRQRTRPSRLRRVRRLREYVRLRLGSRRV
jgi:hypothetical protein